MLFQKHTLNQFARLPFLLQWFIGKFINSAFDTDVLKSKVCASITWVEVPTAYLAQFWVLDGIALDIWSARTHLFNGYQVVMAQKSLGFFWSLEKTWLGFKSVVFVCSTLFCSNWTTWYFSILLVISNILLSVSNHQLSCGVCISFCVSLHLPLLPGIQVILQLHCPIPCFHDPKCWPKLLVPGMFFHNNTDCCRNNSIYLV